MMMRNGRILYVLEPFPIPYGGVATIYRHVEILHGHGLPASVAISKAPARDFYATTAPLLIHGGHLNELVREGDAVVIPEGFKSYLQSLVSTPAKRLMFCQNHHYLPFAQSPNLGIAEFNVDGVIASSNAIRSFFRDVYGIMDVPLLPYAIDPNLFRPADLKKRQIVYMPRKLGRDAAFIESVFKRRYPRHAGVPWIPIHDVSQSEAAKILGESEVFLSLSHRESFGLPPLEAMACGCLAAGFHGEGGLEYMTVENGWWAGAGDWKSTTDGLAAAFDLLDAEGPALDSKRDAMASTVRRYSPARLESELLAFWQKEFYN
jgi:glycosyltransferase involved in cell wall biosynthesis